MSDDLPVKSMPAVPQASNIRQVQTWLEERKATYINMLPPGMNVDRFMTLVIRACSQVPKLLSASKVSLLTAVSQAAELGLEPNGSLGHGWLLPYKDQVQFIPGYRGFIQLAVRSGEVSNITADVVYSADLFTVEKGANPVLRHVPDLEFEQTDEEIRFAYAVAKLRDSNTIFEVVSRKKIDRIMATSKSARSDYSPWQTHYAEMAKKTAVRALAKYLPLQNASWAKMLEIDNEDLERGEVRKPMALPSKLVVDSPSPEREPGED